MKRKLNVGTVVRFWTVSGRPSLGFLFSRYRGGNVVEPLEGIRLDRDDGELVNVALSFGGPVELER